MKHGIILLTLVAFTNLLLGGCTRMVAHQTGESRCLNDDKIVAITLLTGEKIEFNELGGQFVTSGNRVAGIKTNNTRGQWKVRHLKDITVVDLAADEPLLTVFEAQQYKAAMANGKPKAISEAVLKSGERVKFASNSGKISTERQAIVGMDKNRAPVEVPFENIDYVRVRKVNTAVIVGILALTGLIVYSIATWELEMDDMNWNSN